MTDEERQQFHLRMEAEIANLFADTAKLNAQARKYSKESDWYLLIVGSASTLAIVALAKLFL